MNSRFLKTIRFDASDSFAFPLAAEPDEWAISGGFAFADAEPQELKGKPRQAFANGFLGLTSYGYATFTSVANLTDDDREAIIERLAQHFVDRYGAPSITEARDAAVGEVKFIEELVADCMINTLFCVSRSFDGDGQIVEAFRKLERRIDGGPIYLGEGEDQQ
jgi:Family of unknown function (DUF6505)